MTEGAKDLLERAVGWYEPGELDPGELIGRVRRRARRRRITAILAATVVSVTAGAFLFSSFRVERTPASGQTWSAVVHPAGFPMTEQYRGLVWWNGMYVAVGNNVTTKTFGASEVLTSVDGVNWTRGPVLDSTAFAFDLDAVGGHLIAGGFDDQGGAVWISSDASTWRRASVPGSDTKVIGVSATPSAYFAWGSDATSGASEVMWRSRDGLMWQRVPDESVFEGSGKLINDVIEGGPGYVAVGSGGLARGGSPTAGVWTSPDGMSWSMVPDQASLEGQDHPGMVTVVKTDEGLVGFGNVGSQTGFSNVGSSGEVWRSTDGLTWTREDPDIGDSIFLDVVEGGPGFVAVGGGIWTSPDGTFWKEAAADTGCGFIRVIDGPGGLVAVGRPVDYEPGAWCVWTTGGS